MKYLCMMACLLISSPAFADDGGSFARALQNTENRVLVTYPNGTILPLPECPANQKPQIFTSVEVKASIAYRSSGYEKLESEARLIDHNGGKAWKLDAVAYYDSGSGTLLPAEVEPGNFKIVGIITCQ